MKPFAEVTRNGQCVELHGCRDGIWVLTAQEAYELHQAIGNVLPECVQSIGQTEGGKP